MSDAYTKEHRRESIVRLSLIGLCVVVTLVWFIAAILKSPTVPDTFTNSYSASPGGHRAIAELLERNGHTVVRDVNHLRMPSNHRRETLMILEPRDHRKAEYARDFEELMRAASSDRGNIVLALPKRFYHVNRDSEDQRILELHEFSMPLTEVLHIFELTFFSEWFELDRVPADDLTIHASGEYREYTAGLDTYAQVMRLREGVGELSDRIEPLVTTSDGDIIAVRLSKTQRQDTRGFEFVDELGSFVLVSDPDIFSNRYLAEDDMGGIAMAALQHLPSGGQVIIDEALHGLAREARVEYLASTTPGLWVTLSVILLLLLFAWREGTVLRPASAEANMRDNRMFAIEGLGRMLERTRAHKEAAKRIRRRGELVLSTGKVLVGHAAAGGLTGSDTEYVDPHVNSDNDEEELLNAARKIAKESRSR
jgi:hypothetical protein